MRSSLLRCLLAAATVWSLAACATRPPASDAAATQEFQDNNDPYEPANRIGYAINDGLDTYLPGAGRAGLPVCRARARCASRCTTCCRT